MKAQFPTAFCKPIPISLPCIHSELGGGLMADCLVQYLTSDMQQLGPAENALKTQLTSASFCAHLQKCWHNQNHLHFAVLFLKQFWKQLTQSEFCIYTSASLYWEPHPSQAPTCAAGLTHCLWSQACLWHPVQPALRWLLLRGSWRPPRMELAQTHQTTVPAASLSSWSESLPS